MCYIFLLFLCPYTVIGPPININLGVSPLKKPPLFKKLFAAGSVEEEALQSLMAKKKAEDMREELKQIISFTRGPSAWQELLATEASIRKKRQAMIYAQEERRRKIIEIIGVTFLCLVIAGFLGFMLYLFLETRGLINPAW